MPKIRHIWTAVLIGMISIMGALGSLSWSARAGGYVLIVNAKNSLSGGEVEFKEVVKRIYLKEQSKWPNGVDAIAFARDADDPAHAAFLSNVLGMDTGELEKYWARLKQTSGKTPPRAIESERILLRQVGKNDGAFSYAGADAKLPDNVKVLFNF